MNLQDQYDDAMFDFSTGDYDLAIAKLNAVLAQLSDLSIYVLTMLFANQPSQALVRSLAKFPAIGAKSIHRRPYRVGVSNIRTH